VFDHQLTFDASTLPSRQNVQITIATAGRKQCLLAAVAEQVPV